MTENNPIRNAKTRLQRLRAEFDAAKEREWVKVQGAAQTELEDAIWSAKHDDGLSVYAIARLYGTTNRNTIYALLERATERKALYSEAEPATPEAEPEPNAYTWDDHTRTLTHVDSGAAVVFNALGRPSTSTGTMPDGRTLGQHLYADPNHTGWEYVR